LALPVQVLTELMSEELPSITPWDYDNGGFRDVHSSDCLCSFPVVAQLYRLLLALCTHYDLWGALAARVDNIVAVTVQARSAGRSQAQLPWLPRGRLAGLLVLKLQPA
jgi:hypothetical protein